MPRPVLDKDTFNFSVSLLARLKIRVIYSSYHCLCKAQKAREEDNGFKTSTVRNNRLKIKIVLIIAKSGAYIRSELKEFRTVSTI